jgi:hypothetical protein
MKYVNIPPLYMNDDVLEDVHKHKHLGIHICPNGTWKDHLNEIYKKACSVFRLLTDFVCLYTYEF